MTLMLVIYFLFGCLLLWKGGEWLVSGSLQIGTRYQLSPKLMGTTVVAFGTSAPELIVNLFAVLDKQYDIVFGNIIGSNISNLLLILGFSAVIYPIIIKESLRKELIFHYFSLLIFVVWLILPNPVAPSISKTEAILFIVGLLVFFKIVLIKKPIDLDELDSTKNIQEQISPLKSFFYILVGMIALPLGGQLIVTNTIAFADLVGIEKSFISLFAVSIGTSLPELVASSMAAIKKESSMAVGNILGSNIFNILFILGVCGIIAPSKMTLNSNFYQDLSILFFSSTIIYFILKSKPPHQFNKIHGFLALMSYLAYLIYSGMSL